MSDETAIASRDVMLVPLSALGPRERLERRAEVVRSRLLRTVEAIDERRRTLVVASRKTKLVAAPVAAVVLGALMVGTGIAIAVRVAEGVSRLRRRRAFVARAESILDAPLRLARAVVIAGSSRGERR